MSNKRPLLVCMVALSCGILAAEYNNLIVLIATLLFSMWLFLNLRFPPKKAELILMMGIYVFGCIYGGNAIADSKWYESAELDGKYAIIGGEISQKIKREDVNIIYIKNTAITSGSSSYHGNTVVLRFQDYDDLCDNLKIGQYIKAHGNISYYDENTNPGNFNMRDYYRREGTDFVMFANDYEIVRLRYNMAGEAIYRLRCAVSELVEADFDDDKQGIILAMTIGDKSLLDSDVKELYQTAGISHILAISGLHISVIGLTIYEFFRRRKMSYIFSCIFSGLVTFCFGAISGFKVSAQRAIIMFAVILLGHILGRTYDAISSLSMAGIIILLMNPLALLMVSFQLSFVAVIGAVYVYPIIREIVKCKGMFADSVLLSLSIQLTVIPITMFYYFEIPIYGCIINVFVLPFTGMLLGCAVIGCMSGLVFSPVAECIFIPCKFILDGYEIICQLAAKLPFSLIITGKPGIILILIYYGLLAVILENISKPKIRNKLNSSLNFAITFLMPAVYLIFWVIIMSFRINLSTEVIMLDVGQGDGIYVGTKDGMKLFFDGGSTDVDEVGKYRILPFLKSKGVKSIDYWFVSHTDEDHISGLREALEDNYSIKYLVFAKGMPDNENADKLMALAEKNNTKVIRMGMMQSIKYKKTELRCIFPDDGNGSDDINESSMVIEMNSNGFKALFTGDAGEEAEKKMIAYGVLTDVDLLKCGHHGSKNSSSQDFINLLNPEMVIISAGRDNSYGHPHKEALERLRKVCENIYVTSEDGCITIRD